MQNTRIYIASAKPNRVKRIISQMLYLDLPFILDKEAVSVDEHPRKKHIDACSRRMHQQITKEVDKPLLWVEDDAWFPRYFHQIWRYYKSTLPSDWKIAVIGWGLIGKMTNNAPTKIRCASPGWWKLIGYPARHSGSQCVLFREGDYRLEFANHTDWRADKGMIQVANTLKVPIYHSDTVIVGTYDPHNTYNEGIIQYPPLSTPRMVEWHPKWHVRELERHDFIGEFIPITTLQLPKDHGIQSK